MDVEINKRDVEILNFILMTPNVEWISISKLVQLFYSSLLKRLS
ncbi:hypothetical protein YG2_08200 [Tetragenococcus halophilus]|nr:hypothetical protein YG2_08200 [Tetragenococcus halophilus]